MTTLTVSSRPEHDTTLRPVPWRRMAWVTWRQHRVALAAVTALLGALAAYLWRAGLHLHHAWAAATACQPARSIACSTMISDFTFNHDHTATIVPALLQAVPALIGAFLGAPLLARELETGTFRYAWTQGFGRGRWTVAKLTLLALGLTAVTASFSVLFSWYYQPVIADGQYGPLTAIVFNLRGITFAAWTLAAFAIGTLAGTLIRRVVPAIGATLAAYAGLAIATGILLRQHYLTPLVTSSLTPPGSAWIQSQWWTTGATIAFTGRPPVDLLNEICSPPQPGKPSAASITQCLSQHGYTQWTRYQPASRFWPFQWIESGWLFALSMLLIAATLWVVRLRAA
jgi:ABC-2 family transporter protein